MAGDQGAHTVRLPSKPCCLPYGTATLCRLHAFCTPEGSLQCAHHVRNRQSTPAHVCVTFAVKLLPNTGHVCARQHACIHSLSTSMRISNDVKVRTTHVQIWLPANFIFVMMLATGIWALQLVGVAMVTIMKNLSNLITITGDYFMFGRTYNIYVWLSLVLISASAVVGAKTDVQFTWWGYGAQLLNCVFTAAYSLCLRGIMDKVRLVSLCSCFDRDCLARMWVVSSACSSLAPAWHCRQLVLAQC